jgi:hypothetical protein
MQDPAWIIPGRHEIGSTASPLESHWDQHVVVVDEDAENWDLRQDRGFSILSPAEQPRPEPPALFSLKTFNQPPALRPLLLQLRPKPVPLFPHRAFGALCELQTDDTI